MNIDEYSTVIDDVSLHVGYMFGDLLCTPILCMCVSRALCWPGGTVSSALLIAACVDNSQAFADFTRNRAVFMQMIVLTEVDYLNECQDS